MPEKLLSMFVVLIAIPLVVVGPVSCDEGDEAEQAAGEAPAEDTPADKMRGETRRGETRRGIYTVELTPSPSPIPFQELFELKVRVLDPATGEPLPQASLDQVRATMPAHGHGMKNQPEIVAHDDGTFTVEGMRFHMKGEGEHGLWVIQTVVQGPKGIDEATFDIQCCQE